MYNKTNNKALLAFSMVFSGFVSVTADAIEARPHKVGNFDVTASINNALGYSDNAFSGSTVEESTAFFRFEPLVQAINETAKRRITLEYEGDGNLFFDNSGDNFLSTKLHAEYLAKVNATSEFGLGVNFEDGNNIRGTDILEGTNGIVDGPTEFTRQGFSADYRLGSETVGPSLELGYEYTDLEFDNFPEINFGRDYELNLFSARLAYQYSVATQLFVDFAYADFDYSDPFALVGTELDNSESSALAGVKWRFSRLTSGEVSLGVTKKDFDNINVDESVATWNAQIEWSPSSRDSVIIESFSKPLEQAGTGLFQEVKQVSVSWEHSLSQRWGLTTSLTTGSVDFESVTRDDDFDQLGFGVKYRTSKSAEWNLRYEYQDKDSNLAQFDFDSNTILLSFEIGL
ncbi:MAG: outer membrane beta-barrel protein [Arenicella sp.]|nr:outer membrane beta-barrel protein [Arenicella sp.]